MNRADKNKKRKEPPPYTSVRTTVPTERMVACCKRVVHYLKTEKRYTQPSYSLWELAHETGMTAKLISTSINGYMEQNFFELVNRMRVEEAKSLLQKNSKSERKVSLEEIGLQSGFNSRGAFFSRFKEYEGITPRKYMLLNEEENKK